MRAPLLALSLFVSSGVAATEASLEPCAFEPQSAEEREQWTRLGAMKLHAHLELGRFRERGSSIGHGYTFFDEEMRVPLIVRRRRAALR